MVRGGSPKETELTPREREICQTIGPALRERGLLFVGIDVIGGWLTEINVTSPTGIRAIKNLGGPDIAALIWDKIEKKREQAKTPPPASSVLVTCVAGLRVPAISLANSGRARSFASQALTCGCSRANG